ncbi:hypothetical protein FIBSPDRAFT_867997 [Athelia psychrophila]|uniref:Uncharacterized protein n=1 Tax=Athelia psychrophila TaxID=1759441 RepID=A0A166DGU2_9AGAM|nr:hypothetical protein FIBSPDRAFT_867975 [Fibularhizoctonia sp. CBS 109695]KZP14715.1 hypothetical protein FIBSPDRAFT_867997 [Fibularhizoctonia sp. CBS 109695]
MQRLRNRLSCNLVLGLFKRYPDCPIQACGLPRQDAVCHATAQYAHIVLLRLIAISSRNTDDCPVRHRRRNHDWHLQRDTRQIVH